MSTVIYTKTQAVELANVVSIVVTETEQLEEGSYVREIRISTKLPDEQTPEQSLVVRVLGDTLEGVQLTAPPQEY